MSTKLLNSTVNESGFFDKSPVLRRIRDSLFEQDSNLHSSFMTVSNVLVENNEVIQLVVSCDGISTTLDIIIPEIEVLKTNDESILSKEMIFNKIEEDKSKNISVDKSTSCHLITEQEYQQNMQEQEVVNENIVSCPHTCNCDDCPFLKDDGPVIKVILSESEESLNHKESVLSIPHSTTPQETNKRNSFLKITSCMPIRDCKLIIHWNVESYKGILGYRIFIDSNLKSTVHSPRRTCTLISNVNLKRNHLISISIIPDPSCSLPKNIVDTLEQFYYQPIKLN